MHPLGKWTHACALTRDYYTQANPLLVKITEARPYSHEKRWRVSEIVQRGVVVEEIREKELEELRAKEEADRAARRAEEERRAAERLARLAGEEEAPAADVPAETEAA